MKATGRSCLFWQRTRDRAAGILSHGAAVGRIKGTALLDLLYANVKFLPFLVHHFCSSDEVIYSDKSNVPLFFRQVTF